MNDPRGSIWRKWDLHIHTPASFHWSGTRLSAMDLRQKTHAFDEFLAAIQATEVAAFAIMDYWTFDGYEWILDTARVRGISLPKTVFPGMELRVEAATDFRLNIHVLLSPETTKTQRHNFKSLLKVGANRQVLSDEALENIGRTIPNDKATFHGITDGSHKTNNATAFRLGSMTALVTRESLRDAVKSLPDHACVILPYDTSDGLADLDWQRHTQDDLFFMGLADLFETRSQQNIDLILGRTTSRNQGFIENFQAAMCSKSKPAICGSDAHSFGDYGKYPSDRPCWVKADTTFSGILQLLCEPVGRTYIGAMPPKLGDVASNRTQYLQSIEVSKVEGSSLQEDWFREVSLQLNPGVVAIIGNKGSGKSALLDIIALLADSDQNDYFSFLKKERFCQPRRNLGAEFSARLTWENGERVERTLNAEPELFAIPRVRYIPQSYLETVCSSIEAATAFDSEIKKVIFSHLPQHVKVDHATLDEYLEFEVDRVRQQIVELRQALHEVNSEIDNLEAQTTPEHRASIQAELTVKQRQHEEAQQSRPEAVPEPTEPALVEASRQIHERIALIEEQTRVNSEAILTEEQANRTKFALVRRLRDAASRLRDFETNAETLRRELGDLLQDSGIRLEDVLEFRSTILPINEAIAIQQRELELSNARLSGPGSLAEQKASFKVALQRERESLQGPARLYQEYLARVSQWQERIDNIVGDVETSGSLRYWEARLSGLDNLPIELQDSRQRRLGIAAQIYSKLQDLVLLHREAYSPVQTFIAQHEVARNFGLSFSSSLLEKGLSSRFFNFIQQGVAGTYLGVEEGSARLAALISRSRFDDWDGCRTFLDNLVSSLEHDERSSERAPTRLTKQLRKGRTPTDFYDFVFGLEFLEPHYQLTMRGRELHELSPGERGVVLLIFYLLLDKDTIPLLLDQPEENLDNETVYRVLGECLEVARHRRQIILVTHNPNLAVACDAEQVIHAEMLDNHHIRYTSGSIENPEVNRLIVKVLEGTRPAFRKREAKYQAEQE